MNEEETTPPGEPNENAVRGEDTELSEEVIVDPVQQTPQRAPIRGQVARILTTRELVINRGAEHGVTRGMVFEVLDPKGEDIEDPETGEVLGSIDRPKIRVRVAHITEKFAVARTYRYTSRNVGGFGNAFGNLLEPAKFVKKYETFKTGEAAWEDINESESFVKTGDPVREVLSPEE